MSDTTIAFDLGGTKIDICRMTPAGELLSRETVATASLRPGEPSFLGRALALFDAHVGPGDRRVGVSWNAPVHEGRLRQSSLLGGPIELDLGAGLRDRFPGREIRVESDVHAMALGEYRFGVGPAAAPILLINLGSGAGLAYHDGTLMRGFTGGAGLVSQEVRHVSEIGETVTLDYLLSGRGLTRLYRGLTGKELSGAEIAERSTSDAEAARVFDIFAEHLGTYLVTMCRIFDPRTVVLAGSVARAAPLFLDRAKRILAERLEPICQPEAVRVSTLEAAACRGLA
ncbi:ROK family protein [Consotaella salsifontis]|uniref:Sugar kinase of the NBD/HSP70 family, may contain an N-terminal HTH domain n=1 Tax=Consotaella salsifontis TaxID=1365950 RepID=A0A1T4S657_9HYPH|nr:ROK family protein [Consotaella salsifontis]SKA23725.1 Sugar kinase of the NBD/HSP70 family, may contain an N-terminal HTH domain [Consotaella salsifontis]